MNNYKGKISNINIIINTAYMQAEDKISIRHNAFSFNWCNRYLQRVVVH